MQIFSTALFFLLLSIPFCTGVYLRLTDKKPSRRFSESVWAVISIILLVLLLTAENITVQFSNPILPDQMMGIYTSRTGIQALSLYALSGLFLSFLPNKAPTTAQSSHSFFLFGFAIIVFTATDFFTRFLALEFAAILVSLFPLLSTQPGTKKWSNFLAIFLSLRVAGFSMLLFILILFQASGTFHIDTALSNPVLQPAALVAALVFLWLVILIKTGSYPFRFWQKAQPGSPDWFFSVNLITSGFGYYLLYRTYPLLPYTPIIYCGLAIIFLFLGSYSALSRNKHLSSTPEFSHPGLLPAMLILVANQHGAWIFELFLLSILFQTISYGLMKVPHKHKQQALLSKALIIILPISFIIDSSLGSLKQPPIILFFTGVSILLYTTYPFFTYRQKMKTEIPESTPAKNLLPPWISSIAIVIRMIDSFLINLPKYSSQFLTQVSSYFDHFHDGNLENYLKWATALLIGVVIAVSIF